MTQFLKTYDGDVTFQKKREKNFEWSFAAIQIRKIILRLYGPK